MEWISPDCKQFLVGYEKTRNLEIYKAETNLQKPVRVVELSCELNLPFKNMRLSLFERPKTHYFLVVSPSSDQTDCINENEEQKLDKSGIKSEASV